MTVTLEGKAIVLSGTCDVEEAEDLVGLLEGHPGLPVDIGAAGTIHTALWQALMTFKPRLIGTPASSHGADILLTAVRASLERR